MTETETPDTPSLDLTPEQEAAAVAHLTAFLGFMDGSNRTCRWCSKPVETCVKIGRSVYASPCGCRLYQGDVPDWAKPPKTEKPKKGDKKRK